MRVLLSCLQSLKRHALPAYDFWRPYFLNGCREAGIDCLEVPGVDWVEGLILESGPERQAWRDRVWSATLAFATKEQERASIDFFLGYLYPEQVEVGAVGQLQAAGIPCVNFFCDNVREFHRPPPEYAPFDLHWVPEFEALPLYRAAGLPHVHAPMPCWVDPRFRRVPLVETEPPTFIGSADLLRRDLVGNAVEAGADIVVRGVGWSDDVLAEREGTPRRSLRTTLANQISHVRAHGVVGGYAKLVNGLHRLRPSTLPESSVGGSVAPDEYIRIMREAVVSLGINRVSTARRTNRKPLIYSRLRDIEAPMLGACYLTEWTAGLETLFDLGDEIETYRTPEEMASKIEGLKADGARRRSMRELAQRRALATHTVARSLKKISEQIGLGRKP
jgi:hypothetical protein